MPIHIDFIDIVFPLRALFKQHPYQIGTVAHDCVVKSCPLEEILGGAVHILLDQDFIDPSKVLEVALARVHGEDVEEVLALAVALLEDFIFWVLGEEGQDQKELGVIHGILHRQHEIISFV
eukprot:CAMPEP_0170566910 /NCGR_PEP_ID=MMETSP0211-20121228/80141_1 /TAXON_ID=311385 /ORGANISM="Pseudokeronopsis sp., Strain OXSARD2" /LENGTH=120 /DNA_ID=CAMNT_0010888223 /DNA_START=2319 /DNA_END=2681 /DNA_ORIENTATION=+